MELLWDHGVVDVLVDGYDVHYGARSIKYEVSMVTGRWGDIWSSCFLASVIFMDKGINRRGEEQSW